MTEEQRVTLTELTPQRNWPTGRKPDYIDERTRLYEGVTIKAAAREWREILVHFDGEITTAYLTANGFDVEYHGPAINAVEGESACYRKCVREWFRDTYHMEVTFE